MTMTTETIDANAAIKALLLANNVTYLTEGGEKIEKRDMGIDGKPWPCYAWRVSFSKSTTWQTFDYYCGLSHATKPKHSYQTPKPIPPTAADVLHSLVLDATAVNENFSDWCANYGYSDDSIKALRIYQECIETARRLRTIFAPDTLKQIEELLQDY